MALAHCESYEPAQVREALARAVDALGGWSRFVPAGASVVIKPNLLMASTPRHPITTHPEVIRAVCEAVTSAGGHPVIFDLPGLGSLRGLTRKMGLGDLAVLENPKTVRWKPKGGAFGEVERFAFDDSVVVNLAKFKTHGMMGLTLATKNLFGLVSAAQRLEWHMKSGADYDHFAALLVEILCHVQPALNLIDAVVAMEGNGPSAGDPRPLNCLLASDHALSLDAVACRLVGWDPMDLAVLEAARRREVPFDPDADVVGDSLADHAVGDFKRVADPRDNPHRRFGLPGPLFLHQFLRRWTVNRPALNRDACAGCHRCADICPARAIAMAEGLPSFALDKCIRCFCCQEMCPEGAISVRSGILSWLARRRQD